MYFYTSHIFVEKGIQQFISKFSKESFVYTYARACVSERGHPMPAYKIRSRNEVDTIQNQNKNTEIKTRASILPTVVEN